MRSEAPALIPIFRSDHQAQLLAELLLHPGEEASLSDLARLIGVPLSTLHAEARRLIGAGLLVERPVGRSRLLQANTESRLYRPLTELLMLTYGPLAVVREEFADLAGVQLVLIFGSWAARYEGRPGTTPNDIDVMVVGNKVSRIAVQESAERAEQRLHFPVNPVVASVQRWKASSDPLVAQIRAAPTVVVVDRETSKTEAVV
jgi:DNA-binding transcriptional ArsR family regulator